MIWLIIGGVIVLLFGLYKAGPGGQRNERNKKNRSQDKLRDALEKFIRRRK